jgi:hypothetical protein
MCFPMSQIVGNCDLSCLHLAIIELAYKSNKLKAREDIIYALLDSEADLNFDSKERGKPLHLALFPPIAQ